MKIPFADPHTQYFEIQEPLDQGFRQAIADSSCIGSEPLRDFEGDLAKSLSLSHACGASCGAAAIAATLRSPKLGPEAEVMTTARSAAPTVEANRLAGARVIFADIEQEGAFPVAMRVTRRCVSLPRCLHRNQDRVDYVTGPKRARLGR